MKYVGVSAPAWTLLGKWHDQNKKPKLEDEEDFAPPPPSLEHKPLIKSQPKIPTKPRLRQEKVYPPPKEPFIPPPVKSKRKKPMISKAERFPVSKDAAFGPGPTSYQQDIITSSISSKMPNFSFGYRFDAELPHKESELIVLPPKEPIPFLHYPQYLNKEHTKSISIPKAKKEVLEKLGASCAPGPGKYNPKEPKAYQKQPHKNGTFGNPKDPNSVSTREDDRVEPMPAFQDYMSPPKHLPKSKGITRSLSEQQLKKPEPLPYTPHQYFDKHFYDFRAKGPKWEFGKSERPPLNTTCQTDLGPGEYIGLGSQFKPKPPANSLPKLPKAKRRPLNDNTDNVPGPATYPLEVAEDDFIGQKIKNKLHGPAFSMRGKYPLPEAKDKDRMPGPGQYEVHNLNQIGMDERKIGPTIYVMERNIAKKIEKDYDGPDMYNITKDLGSGEGIKFPKAKRQPIATNTDPTIDLGPGYYDLKPTVPQLQPFEQAKLNQLETFNLNLI